MRLRAVILFLVIGTTVGCNAYYSDFGFTGSPPDHSKFDGLLKTYVDSTGWVDYPGLLSSRDQLRQYLSLLSKNPPDSSWSQQEKLAYWINTYNAFTIELVLQHYPIQSIREIGSSIQIPFVNSPWDIKFIEIGDRLIDLNHIEHSILRAQFDEPRIHFAINCASISCPKLLNGAYRAENLDEQLERQTKAFINDPTRNQIGMDKVRVSRIFTWFQSDFTEKGSLLDYLSAYSTVRISNNAIIRYLEYDWSLNEAKYFVPLTSPAPSRNPAD